MTGIDTGWWDGKNDPFTRVRSVCEHLVSLAEVLRPICSEGRKITSENSFKLAPDIHILTAFQGDVEFTDVGSTMPMGFHSLAYKTCAGH